MALYDRGLFCDFIEVVGNRIAIEIRAIFLLVYLFNNLLCEKWMIILFS